MALNFLLFIVGLLLAGLTLRDVFETVVVPGGSRAMLRVAHRVVFALLPLWKLLRGRRRGLSMAFAPMVLVLSFAIWMGLLTLGFGMMTYATRAEFRPRLAGFGDALYLVGSSLATVGLSASHPHGTARWVILLAGFCGLAVMTMAVTYLLEVQGSIGRRDTGIIKLNTSAGEPPSALTLLERFAAIRNQREIAEVMREGRNWCATVRQSHSSHPSLIYFQSVGTGTGWPAALGALLDMALIAQLWLKEEDLYGPAVLLGEEGVRMADEFAGLIDLHPEPAPTDMRELEQVAARLRLCGYPLRDDIDFGETARRRGEYQGCVKALADHLGKPGPVLIRER